MTMQNFVMKEKEAKDYLISEKNAIVETGKIIIYIPEGWQKKITVEVNGGAVCCHQKEPCPGLKISVKKGAVLNNEAAM